MAVEARQLLRRSLPLDLVVVPQAQGKASQEENLEPREAGHDWKHTHSAAAGHGFTLEDLRPQQRVGAPSVEPSLNWRDIPARSGDEALGSETFLRILTSVEGGIRGNRLSTAVIRWVETSWVETSFSFLVSRD